MPRKPKGKARGHPCHLRQHLGQCAGPRVLLGTALGTDGKAKLGFLGRVGGFSQLWNQYNDPSLMASWQGPLNTNYPVKCSPPPPVSDAGGLLAPSGGEGQHFGGHCSMKNGLLQTVVLFCRCFREMRNCPEIQIYTCFVYNENGEEGQMPLSLQAHLYGQSGPLTLARLSRFLPFPTFPFLPHLCCSGVWGS